jgi:D-alanine transaminase
MNDSLVHLNGALLPLSEARIPVLDRGFIFGDGVYEVIPIYNRKMFRAPQHMARLFRSLDKIQITNPHTQNQWMELIQQVVDAYPEDNQMVYLQVTRGVAKRGHAFPQGVTPTVFIMTNPLALPSPEMRAAGIHCVTVEDKRWLHCDIKSISLLGNVLAAQYAVEHGAVEAVQFRDDFLTEGSSSNIWVVKNGKLMAPPNNNLILEGIRYGFLQELCESEGIPFEARQITREEVFDADELLMTSATKEVIAIVKLDDKMIGNGKPGPVYEKLYRAYQKAKAA